MRSDDLQRTEEHAANPPQTWVAVKAAARLWHLNTAGGVTLDSFATRKAAEAARESGWAADLYEKERRWYAGENVPRGSRTPKSAPSRNAAASGWQRDLAAKEGTR